MDTELQQDAVINLSKKDLTDAQVSVLSKGLSFVPTCTDKPFDTKVDLFKFFRKIKLKHVFSQNTVSGQETHQRTGTHFKPKSKFCPIVNNSSINTYCRLVEQEAMSVYTRQTNHIQKNLTRTEEQALNELMKDSSLVIKPADKGGAVVVLDYEKYKEEIQRQLSNERFYRKLSVDPTQVFQRDICSSLEQALLNHLISKPEYEYLCCKCAIRPCLYILPKLHKPKTQQGNYPGRPVVAGIGSMLEPLSNFVDAFIKTHVQALPSYVKDSIDFINKISPITGLKEDCILVTLDVESLYTSIPHAGGWQH